MGFPGPKAEAWKYTQLAPLAKLEFRLPERVEVDRADIAPFLIDDAAAMRLVFVNGRFAADLSDDSVCRKGRDSHEPRAALERGDRRLPRPAARG